MGSSNYLNRKPLGPEANQFEGEQTLVRAMPIAR